MVPPAPPTPHHLEERSSETPESETHSVHEPPIRVPGLLLVGASGRNLGKTALASGVVQRTSPERRIVAIKVTTSEGRGEACGRATPNCGACGSLTGDFAIEVEESCDGDKDTARLRAAGASQCYWVRAKRAHLRHAFRALAERFEAGTAIVCESTSLRTEIVPDVFLLVSNLLRPGGKAAALRVWGDADRVCLWNGESLDFDFKDLSFSADWGRWCLRRQATAIVLAGGASSRMGQDKATITLDAGPLLESIVARLKPHFAEVLVSARNTEDYAELGVPIVADRAPGGGPLVGLASSMAQASHETCFVCACDNPDVDVDLAARLLRAAPATDIVVPRSNGRSEPLFAVYQRSALPHIERALAEGERRLARVFDRCRTLWVELAPNEIPVNLNTPEDLEAFLKRRKAPAP